MVQTLLICRRSDRQLIWALHDLRAGRPTEIASLNLEIARVAAALQPSHSLPRVALLGWLVMAKSLQDPGQLEKSGSGGRR